MAARHLVLDPLDRVTVRLGRPVGGQRIHLVQDSFRIGEQFGAVGWKLTDDSVGVTPRERGAPLAQVDQHGPAPPVVDHRPIISATQLSLLLLPPGSAPAWSSSAESALFNSLP